MYVWFLRRLSPAYPLSLARSVFSVFSSVMSTSRGFDPNCAPTMPAASSWSISLPALL